MCVWDSTNRIHSNPRCKHYQMSPIISRSCGHSFGARRMRECSKFNTEISPHLNSQVTVHGCSRSEVRMDICYLHRSHVYDAEHVWLMPDVCITWMMMPCRFMGKGHYAASIVANVTIAAEAMRPRSMTKIFWQVSSSIGMTYLGRRHVHSNIL